MSIPANTQNAQVQQYIAETRKNLMPKKDNKYLSLTDKLRAIDENRDEVLKALEQCKKQREELGRDAFSHPVVFFATVARHGFSRGKKEGWYITVRPFKVTNGQAHPVALQRIEKLNRVIVGCDLPSVEAWKNRASVEVEDSQFTIQNAAEVVKYQDMRSHCIRAAKATLERWKDEETITELSSENSELKARLADAEARLNKKTKKDSPTKETNGE